MPDLIWSLYRNNSMFPQVKQGLENMRALDRLMGRPSAAFQSVHVAGTNGKGSVSWKVAKSLQAQGYRTGLFVSPHIACYRERVQVDGELIPESAVEHWLPRILEAARSNDIPATFFEITTQLAFCHWAAENVEYVVLRGALVHAACVLLTGCTATWLHSYAALETGLGGRLDSTNIVTPCVSVITSIGRDHVRVLGDTLDEIAMEKAGIIKAGVPVVLGPNAQVHTIAPVAAERGCECTLVPALASHHDFDAENAAVARAALAAAGLLPPNGSDEATAVHRALESSPPSRFEVARLGVQAANGSSLATTVVMDAAHNEMAIERLAGRLRHVFPHSPLRFVVGMSSDKDAGNMLRQLAQLTDTPAHRFHFVSSIHPRAAKPEVLAAALGDAVPKEQVIPRCEYGESVLRGVRQAIGQACGSSMGGVESWQPVASTGWADGYTLTQAVAEATIPGSTAGTALPEVVVVCGSVYLMMEAREAVMLERPLDDPDLQPVGT